MSRPPLLSVVIPVYNRGEVIRHTLESVRRASAGLDVETIVVDDGSDEPIAPVIDRLGYSPARLIRQTNKGLLFARLAGLSAATGRYLLFLDSDDLVSEAKFRLQTAAMLEAQADVSYTDQARCTLAGDFDALTFEPEPALRNTGEAADFYINIQPAPHNPVFRTDYLRHTVAQAYFPPSRLYNPVAEIWFYHNAAPRPGRIIRVPGPHTIIGNHPGVRLTSNWERMAIASLAVMEAFVRTVPDSSQTATARRLVGEVAFRSWRGLPRGFSPTFEERELQITRRLAPGYSGGSGGGLFKLASLCLGRERAGRLSRRIRGKSYSSCRTLSDGDVARQLAQLPPP